MPSSSRLALVVGLCIGSAAFAQNVVGRPERVADLNRAVVSPLPAVPHENGFAVRGDHLYYAGDGVDGVELYRARISGAGVVQVADIHPGGDSHPFAFAVHQGRVFCFADDGRHGYELWVSDGSAAGTAMVRDLYPGLASAVVPQLDQPGHAGGIGVFGNHVWFCAGDGGQEVALFRSDGSAAGTQRISRLGTWRRRTPMQQFTVAGGWAAFLVGDDRLDGYRLWVTDGTAAGTRSLLDLPGGAVDLAPYRVDALGTRLIVTGFDAVWMVDPRAGKVAQLVQGSGQVHAGFGPLADPTNPTRQLMLFSAGTVLWQTDGTVTGTRRFFPTRGVGVLNSYRQEPVVVGGRLYFFGFSLQTGEELWATDGSVLGTVPVVDVRPGPPGSTSSTGFGRQRRLVTSGQLLYFAADDGKSGLELWVSDGSAAGTALVGDLLPGIGAAAPRAVTPIPNAGVAFVADTGGPRPGLWVFEPKPRVLRQAATNYAGRPARTAATRLRDVLAHDDRVYFSADDGRHGSELWVADGVGPAAVRLVRDLRPGGSALRHHDLVHGGSAGGVHGVSVGPDLYFTGYEAAGRLALFRTDGSQAGTTKVRDLDLNGGNGWPLHGVGVGSNLYSHGFDRAVGEGLFRFTAAGAMTLLARTQPGRVQRLGDTVLFTDGAPPNLRGVWASDGTPAGTVALIQFGRPLFGPFDCVRVGRDAVFSVMRGGGELWATDGTRLGTRQLRRAAIRSLAVLDGLLYALEERAPQAVLTRGDGTAAGTTILVGGLPPTSQSLCAVGGRWFFSSYTDRESTLWRSDGTSAGTQVVRRFPLQQAGVPVLRNIMAVGSRRVCFELDTTDGLGTEIWVSDGSTAGTMPVADLRRGPEAGHFGAPVQARGRLWFHGDDGRRGSLDGDLWSVPLGAVAYPVGDGCGSGGFAPRLTGTDPVQGGSLDLLLRGRARSPGVMLLGDPLSSPLDLGGGCRLFSSLAGRFVSALNTDATGAWQLRGLSVPNDPSLAGLRLVVQVALGNSSHPPLGVDLSNALFLIVGD